MKTTFNYITGGEVSTMTELKTIISEMTRRGLFFQIENAYHGRGTRAFFMVRILNGNNND